MFLEKMSYDAATGTVICRSKMHAGVKRTFQVMPGAQWLELLCELIPDRHEHLVRYVGWYSNRARGECAKTLKAQDPVTQPAASVESVGEFANRAKATWARLIRKVYEADLLLWPKCKSQMRVIALIHDPGVVRRIVEHLGRWAPEFAEQGPPAQAPDWPHDAVISPGPRYRVAQREVQVWPHLHLAPLDRHTCLRICAILIQPVL